MTPRPRQGIQPTRPQGSSHLPLPTKNRHLTTADYLSGYTAPSADLTKSELQLLLFAGLPRTFSPRRHMLLAMPLLGLGTAQLDKGNVRKVQRTEQAVPVIFSSLQEGSGVVSQQERGGVES